MDAIIYHGCNRRSMREREVSIECRLVSGTPFFVVGESVMDMLPLLYKLSRKIPAYINRYILQVEIHAMSLLISHAAMQGQTVRA